MRGDHHLDIPMLCHHHGPLSLLLSWTTGTVTRPGSPEISPQVLSIQYLFFWDKAGSLKFNYLATQFLFVGYVWPDAVSAIPGQLSTKKYPLRLNYGPGSVKAIAQQTPASSTMSPGTENAQEFSQIFWTGAMPWHDVYHPRLRGVSQLTCFKFNVKKKLDKCNTNSVIIIKVFNIEVESVHFCQHFALLAPPLRPGGRGYGSSWEGCDSGVLMGRPGGSHSPYIIMDIGESIKSGTRISAARRASIYQ